LKWDIQRTDFQLFSTRKRPAVTRQLAAEIRDFLFARRYYLLEPLRRGFRSCDSKDVHSDCTIWTRRIGSV
jgi:hypothetical protein